MTAPSLFDGHDWICSGHILTKPVVRSLPIDGEGHVVPVLCMDIESDGPARLPIHVEQPFPMDHYAQCEAAAKRYRKGQHITVQAPAVGLRLAVTNVAHIHTDQPQEPQ